MITRNSHGVLLEMLSHLKIYSTNVKIILEEPHAPQIKRDDEVQQDVGGAYAGPFNEGEELKLLCEVHGGR